MNDEVIMLDDIRHPDNPGYSANFANFANSEISQNKEPYLERHTSFHQMLQEDSEQIEAATYDAAPSISNAVYSRLPSLLSEGCAVFAPTRERDIFLTSALPILSGCFNMIWGVYDGRIVYPNLYAFTVAPPASGKGVMKYAKALGNDIHNEMIKGNALSEGRRMLFVPGNSSAAAIMKHIEENRGSAILCENESDTLSGSLKSDWGGFSDLLRKAFQHETFSYSRKKNNEYFEVNNPKLSITLTGTPNQVERLIHSNEDGLFSRFMWYCFNTPVEWKDVSSKDRVNLDEHFLKLSQRVNNIFKQLKETSIEFKLCQSQWDYLNSFYKSRLKYYDDDVASSVVRAGLITFRIAMILTVLQNENNLKETNVLICDEDSFEAAIILGKSYLEYGVLVFEELLKPQKRSVDTHKQHFLHALPAISFKRLDAVEIGNSLNISPRSIDSYLKEFSDTGLLKHTKNGIYIKY